MQQGTTLANVAKFPMPFGQNAGSSYITKPFPTASQSGTNPLLASLNDGFPAATMQPGGAPYGQDFTGILYWITAYMQFLQAGGIAPYDATYSGQIGGYPKNALCASSANAELLWLNTTDNNTTDPDVGGASGWIATGPAALGALATITPGTGVATALAVNVGSAGAPVVYNGGLGTPSSGALSNCSGLPVGGISGLGTGIATAFANAANSVGGLAVCADPTVQRLTSGSGTYMPTSGTARIRVRMLGGGGGGGADGGYGGATGGTTTLGVWTAIGGGGGGGGAGEGGSGGTGGSNSTGTLIIRMQGNGGSAAPNGVNSSGAGGGGPFGGGAAGQAAGAAGTSAAANSGGGGSGTGSSYFGGGGGAGEYVEFFIPRPGPMSYQVGSGGAGGNHIYVGGNGGSGIIIVEEFYS